MCCRLGSSCGVVSYLARRRVPTPSAAGASPCSPAAASLSPRVPAAFARRDGEGEMRGGGAIQKGETGAPPPVSRRCTAAAAADDDDDRFPLRCALGRAGCRGEAAMRGRRGMME